MHTCSTLRLFASVRLQSVNVATQPPSLMARCKNSANALEVARALRGCSKTGPSRQVLTQVSIEHVIEGMPALLCEIVSTTPRPIKKILAEASADAWDYDHSTADLFAVRVISAIHHCRVKAKQCTSMKKLPAAVAAVAQALKRASLKAASPTKGSDSQEAASPTKRRDSQEAASPTKGKFVMSIVAKRSLSDRGGPVLPARDDAAALRQRYGLPPVPDVLEVVSSQETICSDAGVLCDRLSEIHVRDEAPSSSDRPAPRKQVQYFDSRALTMVRTTESGKITAKMIMGANGFAQAVFEGEEPIDTECPNVLLSPVMKRPAGVMKRPAAERKVSSMPMDVFLEEEELNEQADGSEDSDGVGEESAGARRVPAMLTTMSNEEKAKRRKLTYSRVYHRERFKQETAGMDVERSKELAKVQAQRAVQEELFAD